MVFVLGSLCIISNALQTFDMKSWLKARVIMKKENQKVNNFQGFRFGNLLTKVIHPYPYRQCTKKYKNDTHTVQYTDFWA